MYHEAFETECNAMHVDLTPEQERIVREKLKSGLFRTAEEVIGEALHALREKEGPSREPLANGFRTEAVQEMLDFVEKNRVDLEDVSVKNLIHEGHRL